MRVAFLGPAGTFTEEALRASAPAGVREQPHSTVYETVMAVERGEADAGVVPIENSLEGSVTATLDTLTLEAPGLRIVAEVVHPIRHCLIARPGLTLGALERVVSHPQALAQCESFLRAQLADVERAPATSTAEAVRTVLASPEPWAAIGSRLSVELYSGAVLAEGIEDRADNMTRFVWLARAGAHPTPTPSPRARKTSVVFWGFNDASPGALVDVLSEFADRDINLTRIESRPRRAALGRYMFFVDLEGGEHEPAVAGALAALAGRVETLRVLGSYAAA